VSDKIVVTLQENEIVLVQGKESLSPEEDLLLRGRGPTEGDRMSGILTEVVGEATPGTANGGVLRGRTIPGLTLETREMEEEIPEILPGSLQDGVTKVEEISSK
jgi:hypothetical protein